MNLVWLARKPTLGSGMSMSESEQVPIGLSGAIRMRVHTVTEVYTDHRRSRDNHLDTVIHDVQDVRDISDTPSPKAYGVPDSPGLSSSHVQNV